MKLSTKVWTLPPMVSLIKGKSIVHGKTWQRLIMFAQKEESTIGVLYRFLHRHPNEVIEVEFENEPKYQAIMDTAYDTDNGLEMDEEGYEEFYAILLRRLEDKELIELTYRHFPRRITCNGEFVAGTDNSK